MAFSINQGIWPVMITPYTNDHKIDFKGVTRLCDWYIEKGCAGIFAVCQSSEMVFLSEDEKLDLARAVVDAVGGRIQVVASGHTGESKAQQFREIESMMKIPGIGAYVLISNRLDPRDLGEEVFEANVEEIFQLYPEIDFGIYECPTPWKRLVSTEFLRKAGKEGRMVFLKDTCCDYELVRERQKAVDGTPLKIYNANAQSWFDGCLHGTAGYSGIMANFHPQLYKWAFDHKSSDPIRARQLAHYLALAAMIEMRCYPCSAKLFHKIAGVPMNTYSRTCDESRLDKNAAGEVESLIETDKYICKTLGIEI